ncbi:MAG: ribonuclease D [Solirubrobacterales bacterium]
MADAQTIEEVAARARETGQLAIDTEFVGEGRYLTELCLVQVAVRSDDDGPDRVELIDPIEGDGPVDPLADLLADPAVEVVLHAGRQDIALLRRCWETPVTNIFDTQVAAAFAGLRAQIGYEPMLGSLLGLKLPKGAGFTHWDRRPLSSEQLEYARGDVLHLLEAADAIKARLAESGRTGWVTEECRPLEESSDVRDPRAMLEKLPKAGSLDPDDRAVALALLEWRDKVAARENRPPAKVVPDAAIVDIARRAPADREQLGQIRGLHEGILRRRGRAIVEAVQAGLAAEPVPRGPRRTPATEGGDAALIVVCESLVRARAAETGLAYELLASRADLQAVINAFRDGESEPGIRTLEGWRREVVGDELLMMLAGQRSLRVDTELRVVVEE